MSTGNVKRSYPFTKIYNFGISNMIVVYGVYINLTAYDLAPVVAIINEVVENFYWKVRMLPK